MWCFHMTKSQIPENKGGLFIKGGGLFILNRTDGVLAAVTLLPSKTIPVGRLLNV